MGIINVLDINVANLIAAGEVVERPASVIKELLENSIDAGAAHITVEIKNGGVSFMRVGDDGCGMSRDDVPVCVMRHATSKIRDERDLDGILTLGFRGEALAAIASVSKLRIMTKNEIDDIGTLLICECGEIKELGDIGCKRGTMIIIEELFANFPARKKFLKKDITESMAVTAVVEKIALSRPDIAIKYITDGTVKFDTPGDGKLQNTIYAVLGRDYAKKMIPVKDTTQGISITGFISIPENTKGNRNYQNIFLNKRYIKSGVITAAFEEAYNTFIETNRYPSCVLNIEIHPSFVDVNVHPAKLEVKFSNEKAVFAAVYSAAKNSLMENTKRPEFTLKDTIYTASDISFVNNAFASVIDPVTDDINKREDKKIYDLFESKEENDKTEEISSENLNKTDKITTEEKQNSELIKKEIITETINDGTEEPQITQPRIPKYREELKNINISNDFQYKKSDINKAENSEIIEKSNEIKPPEDIKNKNYKIMGVVYDSYIIVETTEKLLIIDKHAAHERLIFEQMKYNMQTGNKFGYSQILLVPIVLKFTPVEYAALVEYKNDIEMTGLSYIFDDEDNVQLFSIPSVLNINSSVDMLNALAAGLGTGVTNVENQRELFFEEALYQASCKASMKAGRKDAFENIEWLVSSLMQSPDIQYCPHGRPVAFDITKSGIEKQFKRT